MPTQLIVRYKIKITDVLKNGFIGTEEESKGFFTTKARLQDTKCLSDNKFKIGDIVEITINVIDVKDIRNDKKNKEFYCVINEFSTTGFYTKEYDENENRFKREFWYNERGMITIPNKEQRDRFEIGDILKVQIKNARRNL